MARKPMVFATEVHCKGCGKKIKNALERINSVESVWFQVGYGDSGRVFVDGLANAVTLKAEIQRKNKNKSVTIVDFGGSDVVEDAPPPRPVAAAPASSPPPAARTSPRNSPPPPSPPASTSSYYTPTYSPPPTSSSSDYPPGGYYSYYAPPPAPPGGHYPPLAAYYNYDQSRGGPYYMPNYAPTTFNDENPNACSIQ